ncbi:hypothetical protein GPECTOR_129g557 [Gonium pectorale]|uniref:Uncharacterized protein n=1 Tax=Gonium pectorale TaxID=33097 RepID=A0A150FYH2_GONPE|nr:hypothetical protein GPECTOR_129g557 [Gonium pectorale]|eukprot:KXZ42627.1 hypothetical protein GPECTOR_129g557 [Gonium pectorale]
MNQAKNALVLLRSPGTQAAMQQLMASSSFGAQQFRHIGGDKVPEFWGRPSQYTEGTNFLGTPKNHLDLINKRPLSPDVFDIDHKSPHYKFPLGALSSIVNRVTGVAMSVGFAGAGVLALRGGLDPVVSAMSGSLLLGFPAKFLLSYCLIYHYAGALRHFTWDHHKIGNNADRTSLMELPKVELSSKLLLGGSAALALICALL